MTGTGTKPSLATVIVNVRFRMSRTLAGLRRPGKERASLADCHRADCGRQIFK